MRGEENHLRRRSAPARLLANSARRICDACAWCRIAKYLLDYGKTDPALAAAYMCSGLTAFGAMKKVGKLGPDDQVLVLGVGGVGMMGVQFAKALFGKGPIAADIDDARLEAAKKAGASATYNTKDPAAAKQLMGDTGGGAYAVVDFVGSEKTFAFANASRCAAAARSSSWACSAARWQCRCRCSRSAR